MKNRKLSRVKLLNKYQHQLPLHLNLLKDQQIWGGMGAAGAALQSGMGGKTSGVNKMDREILVPTNSVPGLIAVDTKNMHVLHSKSVFNIVDAI